MTQRIALVTGGSRGLGKNAALKLAAKGTDILLTYHSNRQAALDVVAEIEQKGVKAAALALNVGDSTTFDAFASEVAQVLAQKWGRTTFDYLLNNAGIGLNAPFAETSEAQFDELMNIQFKGPFFLTQRLLPLLQDGGVSSMSPAAGALCPAGLCGLRRDEGGDGGSDPLSGERAGRTGISVNIIAPGAIETDFGGGEVRDNAEVNRHIAAQTALGRVGLPDDIGDAIAALLSDELAWMNAQRVEVSGGMFL